MSAEEREPSLPAPEAAERTEAKQTTPEAVEASTSPETPAEAIGEAEAAVVDLKSDGIEAATKLARRLDTPLDNEVQGELSTIVAESEAAKTELVTELAAADVAAVPSEKAQAELGAESSEMLAGEAEQRPPLSEERRQELATLATSLAGGDHKSLNRAGEVLSDIDRLNLDETQTHAIVTSLMNEGEGILLLENADRLPLSDAEKQDLIDATKSAFGGMSNSLMQNIDKLHLSPEHLATTMDGLIEMQAAKFISNPEWWDKLDDAHRESALQTTLASSEGASPLLAKKFDTLGLPPEKQAEIVAQMLDSKSASTAAVLIGRGVLNPEQHRVALESLLAEPEVALINADSAELSDEQRASVVNAVLERNPDFVLASAEEGRVKLDSGQLKQLVSGLVSHGDIMSFQINSLKRFGNEADPQTKQFIDAAERVVNSPSESMRRLSGELLRQLADVENPDQILAKVEDIFIRNQLPLAGKLYKVFEVLNPQPVIEEKLAKNGADLSPTLKAESHRGRMFTVYKDLLRTHIDSNNPSMREYLETLRSGQDLVDQVDADGIESLAPEDRERFDSFIGKMDRLQETSLRGRMQAESESEKKTEPVDAVGGYERVRSSLGLRPGQKMNERVAEMYLKPIGLESIDAALARMDESRRAADQRNREAVTQSGGQLTIGAGDLFKGIDDRYLQHSLEDGFVAKEFLGSGADSDLTPLDTDLSRVTEADAVAGVSGAYEASLAKSYGNLVALVRDRGQFQETSSQDDPVALGREARRRAPQMELFRTGKLGERHYGIRTGFPSSEVDAFLATEELTNDASRFDSRLMDIAAHDQYIPVADTSGKVIFSPEKYDDYRRRFFGGTEGVKFERRQSDLESQPEHQAALQAIIEAKRRERPELARVNGRLHETVTDELQARGIEVGGGYDNLLTAAEVYDTGSSSRGTNVPGSYDFDYIVKLNSRDIGQAQQVNDDLVEKFGGTTHEDHRPSQLRVLGANIDGETADVDVGFVTKGEGSPYESHQAVKDRLEAIRSELGESAHEEVVANIVLAKQVLKEAGAYKKGAKQEGGMGGIGVENWILSEGGSAAAAFEAFERSAFDGEQLRSFEEFKRDYKVLDPGLNAKKRGQHDNFIELMTPEGYARMAGAARGYLEKLRQANPAESTS